MIIAHRGVHDNLNVPENSILSFEIALKRKYDIEFDIQITKDNKLVIFHDHNILRMTGVNRNISDMTYEEVKNIRLLDTNQTIPTFSEVLKLVDGKVLLDIEIKNTKKIDIIVSLILSELKNYRGKILLKSFNPFIVRKLKQKTKKYTVGLLIMRNSANKLLNFLVKTNLIYSFNPDFIAVDKNMLTEKYYLKYVKKYKIYVWAFNNMVEVERYLEKYPEIICISNGLM